MSKHVGIDIDCPVDLPAIYGDRIQLQQVVLNLVRNAVDSIGNRDEPMVASR